MNPDLLAETLERRGEPAFRLRQALDAVFRRAISSWSEAGILPAPLREALEREVPLLSLRENAVKASSDGRAHKAILRLADGKEIESVLLKSLPGDSWTACVSCQVGCAMGCTFCATGLMGLSRSLAAEEIADQVLFWRQYLAAARAPGRLGRVVYMGMGEPLHALESVRASLRLLGDPRLFAMAARHISVSTVGIAPAMEAFAREFPQVNFALSLHAAEDELRSRLVPANRAYPLERLAESLRRILAFGRRKIFLEYVLLKGENDGPEQAKALVRFVRSIGRVDLLHVNLIVWNPTDTSHEASGAERARAFKGHLRKCGLSATIRKNLGADIEGACGQLIRGSRSRK